MRPSRETLARMSQAAAEATAACMARGYSRGDKVTIDSAYAAAANVLAAESTPAEKPVGDGWVERSDLD